MPLDIRNDGVAQTAPTSYTALYYLKRLVELFGGGGGGIAADVNVKYVGGELVDPDEHAVTEIVGTVATDKSGTITTGGAAQTAIAANTERREWTFINNSDTPMRLRIGATASATAGMLLNTDDIATGVETNAISIYGATTGKEFTAWER